MGILLDQIEYIFTMALCFTALFWLICCGVKMNFAGAMLLYWCMKVLVEAIFHEYRDMLLKRFTRHVNELLQQDS